jgi:hypothetical protein
MEGIIYSFNQVVIKGSRPLIICDIDETLLRWENSLQDIYNKYSLIYPNLNHSNLEIMAENHYSMYRNETPPIPTDDAGFKLLLTRLGVTGKLMFLTARSPSYHTRDDLDSIGLENYMFDIHFTANKIPKGEYIKKYIDISSYDDIIFIDDNPVYINSVLDIFSSKEVAKERIAEQHILQSAKQNDVNKTPKIRCYLFRMKTASTY